MSASQSPSDNLNFLLRQADDGDLPFARELIRNNMVLYYKTLGVDWDDEVFEETWRLTFNAIVTLAEPQEEQAIGVVRMHIGDQEAVLWDLQLTSQYRSQGIGGQLLQRCIQVSRDAGCQVITLNVCKINPAHALYLRAGFQPESETEHEIKMRLPLS